MTENETATALPSRDPDTDRPTRTAWKIAGFVGGMLALLFLVAFGAGFMTAAIERGTLSPARVAIGATIVASAGLALWMTLRSFHALRAARDLSRRDRRNMLFIVVLFVVGAVIGAVLAMSDHDAVAPGTVLLASGPISPAVALALAFVTVVVLPITYWYYHRHVIDELDEAAYREGALYALYGYATIAPAWWLLWRGGWVGAPDGEIIFIVTLLLWLLFALRAKYR